MLKKYGFAQLISRIPMDFGPKHCGASDSGACPGQYLRRERDGIRLQDKWFCSGPCFERGMLDELHRLSGLKQRCEVSHRIPLGLILLSRGVISQSSLEQALSAQRAAGEGKIGEWLIKNGAVEEYEITKALSEQWGRPVLRSCPADLRAANLLPFRLLEAHRMMPFHYSLPRQTLYIAFSDGISHSAIDAVESMLDCRTEACFVVPSIMDRCLEQIRQSLESQEVVFERVQSDLETAATVRSYAIQCSATAARMAICGQYVWIRLLAKQNLDLLFRSVPHASSAIGSSHVVQQSEC